MKNVHLILAASVVCFSSEGKKAVFKGNTISFSESIGDAGKKRIRFKYDSLRYDPFNQSLIYDSTALRIFQIEAPLALRDSLEPKDMGILSVQWGVRDPKGNRYLNITDLKKIGKKKIDAETIQRWIIGGMRVKSNERFRDFVDELRDSNIVTVSLEKGFAASVTESFHGFCKESMVILIDQEFVRFSYLISAENEVMLLKKDALIQVYSPNPKSLPGMPSFITLANPGDSAAYKVWSKYTETIRKYDYELFN